MVWDRWGWFRISGNGTGLIGMVQDMLGWLGMVWDKWGWYGIGGNGSD